MSRRLVDALRRPVARFRTYTPERWSLADWERAYGSGHLAYFDGIDEVARYGVLAAYIRLLPDGASVLDIGCGAGGLRRHLPNNDYVGVDLFPTAIATAQQLFDGGRSQFVCADVMTADLDAADVVVLNEVLYFAIDPSAMIRRAVELRRRDGKILVSMWRHPGDRYLWRQLDRHLRVEDVVHLRNPANRLARRGWKVACCGERS